MNIKKERNSIKVSQHLLAKVSGVGRFKISLIELGYAKPTTQEISKLRNAIKKLTEEHPNVHTRE